MEGLMSLSTGVWNRAGSDSLTRGMFYLFMGAIMSWGFIATRLVAQATGEWQPGILMLLLVGLGVPIIGIFLSIKSDNPLVSFLGFNLVVIGLSAILGPVLAMYELKQPGLIERAAGMTACATFAMGLSGLMFPNFYRQIGGILFGALAALVVVSIARLFIPAIQDVGIIDYLAAGIFSLYIGYDMYRASTVPATLDNAIDCCVELYLSIMNLFLTLLRITGDD